MSKCIFKEIADKLNKEEVEEYYKTHLPKDIAKYFKTHILNINFLYSQAI